MNLAWMGGWSILNREGGRQVRLAESIICHLLGGKKKKEKKSQHADQERRFDSPQSNIDPDQYFILSARQL